MHGILCDEDGAAVVRFKTRRGYDHRFAAICMCFFFFAIWSIVGMTEIEMREAKKAHAQRLENRGGGGSRAGLLSSAGDTSKSGAKGSGIGGISQDKLLELRAKRLSHKRNTIVS